MTSSKQRHLDIKEPFLKEPIHEVEITSFDRHPPHVRQIRQSIDDIEHRVFNAGGMCVYPTHGDPNDDTGICRLVHERVKSSLFQSGVAYTAKRMNVSANIDAEPRPTEALYDAILFVPDEPATVFTVISDKITRRKHSEALHYNQSIAKGIVAAVRKYTDEQFSVVFGLLREAELSDDVRFKKAIDRIHAKSSQLAVPLALSMFEKKFRKVLRAFLVSLAVTDCVGRTDAENSLWVLTLEQFCVLTENIDHKQVTVNTMPSCGGTVLLLEVAKRLQRSGPTMIVTQSDGIAEQARTLSVCEYVFNADQFQTEATHRKPDIVNVVADCEVTSCFEDQSRKGMTWYFIQKALTVAKEERSYGPIPGYVKGVVDLNDHCFNVAQANDTVNAQQSSLQREHLLDPVRRVRGKNINTLKPEMEQDVFRTSRERGDERVEQQNIPFAPTLGECASIYGAFVCGLLLSRFTPGASTAGAIGVGAVVVVICYLLTHIVKGAALRYILRAVQEATRRLKDSLSTGTDTEEAT